MYDAEQRIIARIEEIRQHCPITYKTRWTGIPEICCTSNYIDGRRNASSASERGSELCSGATWGSGILASRHAKDTIGIWERIREERDLHRHLMYCNSKSVMCEKDELNL